jgi:hypothetical protein
VHFQCLGPGVSLLETIEVRDCWKEVANGERKIGRVCLGDRRANMQQETLVVVGTVENMDFQAGCPSVRPLEAIKVGNAVLIEVANGERKIGRVCLGDRRASMQQETLVVVGTVENMDFQAGCPSVRPLEAIKVGNAVLIEVVNG